MSNAQPRTVVVLIDDEWLKQRERTAKPANWPLSASDWASVIARVDRAGPRAIALDVAFLDDRPDPGLPLMQAVMAGAGGRVPVFVAAGSTGTGAIRPISQGLKSLTMPDGPVRLTSVLAHEDLASLHAYSFQPDSDGHPNMVRALVDTIAPRPLPKRIELLWPSPDREECELHDEKFRRSIKSGCGFFADHWFSSLGTSVIASLFDGLCDGQRQGRFCGHVPPIYIDTSPVPTLTLAALEDPRQSDRVDRLMRGAVVFIGQNFAFSQDLAYSPVYGSVPGVAVHAVAFRNAVSLPGGGLTDPEGTFDRLRVQCGAVVVFLLVLMLCEYAAETWLADHPISAKQLEWSVLAALAVLAAWVTSSLIHYGPANWLGITAVCGTALACVDMGTTALRARIRHRS